MKNYPATFAFLLLAFNPLISQDFYDISTVQEIKLTFFQTNWDYKLDSLQTNDESAYLLAASVEINGEIFDSVGVKYKGNSSYSANNQKNPLHIALDYVHGGADYQGYKDVKLGNGFADPSFVREALSYEILGQYMEAPRSNFAKIWMNGVYWGVYSNQEAVSKTFIRNHHYTDGDNPFFKCTPVGGAGPGGNSYPDLVYSSADSAAYYSKYEIKSDYGWRELLALMDTLKNHPNGIAKVLDVDRALWMIAFNDVLVNLDSYTGAFAQNYYLYLDENGRWIPTVWDLNMCIGGFPNLGSGGGPGGGLSLTQMQNMDPLIQSANASRPLISKLLAIPQFKRQYLAHLRTIAEENFATTDYRTRALELQAVIAADVQADTKKFYTYANFTSNIDNSVAGGGGGFGAPGITQLMNARYTYLHNNAVVSASAPAIGGIVASPASPAPGETVWITANISNATAAFVGYRSYTWEVFQHAVLYDDGAHNDGAAADGVYGASFPSGAAQNQYYIFAENASTGRFSPERAEFEFYTIQTNISSPGPGDVVINEVLAVNETGANDEAGELEDWLELYNRTGNTYDLGGMFLSDKTDNAVKWAFPHGSIIAPHGYLVVWLDEDGSQGPLHANFKISSAGEAAMLSDSTGTVYDSISFGAQTADVSFGRYPNGTGSFTAMPPTFGAENSLSSGVSNWATTANWKIYPNPAGDWLNVESDQALGVVRLYNLLGQSVLEMDAAGALEARLTVGALTDGIYFLQADGFLPQRVVVGR